MVKKFNKISMENKFVCIEANLTNSLLLTIFVVILFNNVVCAFCIEKYF